MEQVQDIDTGSHYWFQAPLKTFSDKLVDFPWSNFALLNNIQLLKFFQGINLSLQVFFKTTILLWNDKVQHLNKFNISLIICAKVESSRTSMGWRHGFVKYIIFCIQNKQIIQNFPIMCKKIELQRKILQKCCLFPGVAHHTWTHYQTISYMYEIPFSSFS